MTPEEIFPIINNVAINFIHCYKLLKLKIMEYKKTEFYGKKAIIKSGHPHYNEIVKYLGTEKTPVGWGMKFKNEDTGINFYVWDSKDVRWLLDRDINTKRKNKINLSKRQVQKLIDELKMFL